MENFIIIILNIISIILINGLNSTSLYFPFFCTLISTLPSHRDPAKVTQKRAHLSVCVLMFNSFLTLCGLIATDDV